MNAWQDYRWNDWVPLSRLNDVKCDLLGRGVYAIGAERHDGMPVPIQRVYGCDTEGVLLIGQGSLSHQIRALFHSVDDECDSQAYFATKLFANTCLSRIFDPQFLRMRWCEAEDSRSVGSKILDSYLREFGELPPGNSQSFTSNFS